MSSDAEAFQLSVKSIAVLRFRLRPRRLGQCTSAGSAPASTRLGGQYGLAYSN